MLLFFISLYSPGTLPYAQNSPQKCKYDLYAEQVRTAYDDVIHIRFILNVIFHPDDGDVVCRASFRKSICVRVLNHTPQQREQWTDSLIFSK